ncbi:MAG TPA: RagB/SusD family nutrient uptake outer membrane protein [Bacteroidales bacterium]|nr:RagB/SusD family nutrient uptake outer membrane protein [Bacteroidales bacterium]HPR73759.1 RagB/SusD family nutrient uptake outer membrane protein [Bacteroidales bacterium]
MRKLYIITLAVALLGISFSCSKESLDPTLAQSKILKESINTSEDLYVLMNGVYNRMTQATYYGRDLIIFNEVRSDNCFSNGNSGRFVTVAAMALGNSDAYVTDTWTQIYAVISAANLIIESASIVEGDQDEINHIKGQALAVRALAHFDLLKLFGQQHVTGGDQTLGIPYVTEFKSDNLLPARNTVAQVRTAIETDFSDALDLMSEELNYSDPVNLNNPKKQYITTWAVNALQARVAAYFGDWPAVVTACEAVIESEVFDIITKDKYVGIWEDDNPVNSIFELAFSNIDNQNINGLQYIYRGDNYGDIEVLADLSDLFEQGDVRGDTLGMIGLEGTKIRNMGKYPSIDYSDDIFLIRYEEVVLLYAEALYEIDNTDPDALVWLNKIPENRNATLYTEATKDNIMLERRKELAFEGFRFDDLARTQSDIPLVSPLQQTHDGPLYGSYKYAFPIPRVELNANSSMVQNFGYSSTK